MGTHHHIQIAEMLVHMAGDFFAREAGNPSVNGLITVTRSELKDDLKSAVIFFSVLPSTKENDALKFARRARSDFRDYVKQHTRLHPVPFIDFEIDYGEKNRQRVDELTRK